MSYRRDITVGNIVPSALGGVASALALSYFGVAGSVIGAAAGPVVFLLVKELTRGPTEEVVARSAGRVRGAPAPEGDGPPSQPATRVVVRRRRDLALGALLATAAISALLAIALITIPELIRGESLVGSGRTTLFDPGGGGGSSGGATGGEEDAPAQTVTAPSTAEEPTTTTAPGTTTTAPEETVPQTSEDPVTTDVPAPATTTPAPEAPLPEPSGDGGVPAPAAP